MRKRSKKIWGSANNSFRVSW